MLQSTVNHDTFDSLPESVRAEVMEILMSYDKVNVVFEYGEYDVMVGCVLTSEYAPDHRFVGTFAAKDFYTDEQRIENYCNSFASYPVQYKGARDYALMREVKESGYKVHVKLVNGNIVRA